MLSFRVPALFHPEPRVDDVAIPKRNILIPAIMPLLVLLALACAEQGSPPGAGLAGDPMARGRSAFLLRRGLQFLADGEGGEAVRVLEEARRLDPASPALSIALGRAYWRDDRFAAARVILNEALRSSSAGIAEKDDARRLLVEILLSEGKLDAARRTCEPLLRVRPVEAASRRLAGMIAYRAGEPERARSELAEAVRLAPDDAEARAALGVTLLQLGDLDAAAAALEQAVGQDPGSHSALSNLAKVYERQGRKEEAEATRRRFQEVYDQKSFRQKLGPLRKRGVEAYNAGRLPEALEAFQAILQLSPRDPQALAHVGSVLLAMQRLDEAEDFLRRALEVRPENDFAWTELGRIHALRNDLPGAIEKFTRASAANPYAPEPHYFLAGIYYAQRRKEDFLRERAAYERLRQASASKTMMDLPEAESR